MKYLKLFFTICALAVFSAANAQELLVLSENHAMLRIPAGHKYLLMPVEESQEYDYIRVSVDNKLVKELNCKLAVNKIDYTVPLNLARVIKEEKGSEDAKGEIVVDITFNRSTGNPGGRMPIRNFACWKGTKVSNTFDSTNREKWRPVYHHTPNYGWMNDPNGMFYKDGIWHLFFQLNPYGSQWENMTWGHSTSKDLIHWNYEGEAIERDAFGTIFSGSSVVDTSNTAGFGKGAIISYYTSAGQSQTQSMAYSTDNGKTFTKYAANPVLTSEIPDFRDPNIIWHEATKRWILILAEKTHVKFYSSTDLKNWTFESNFGEEYGNHDGVWECPDIFEINGKWFILLNINPGGPFGGSATQYFVGDFDGHKFTCEDEPTETKWLDYGKDHYATVSFSNAPDGRIVVIPWMSNWQYGGQVPTTQYRSANGLPRDLSSFDYKGETYLSVKPSKEVYAAFSKKATGHLSNACRVDVQLKGNATITLSNSKGEQVVISYNAKNEKISMDRTKSGEVGFSAEFPVVTASPTYGKIKTLQIFIDSSSIEIFDAAGKVAMTNIVFPTEPYNIVRVKGGKAKVFNLAK
ncbi:MAG: DUF4980 domain-containing protein [Prevotella sp.]|nr:DUF4980 domain-containing protein [Prevotella sp.]